MSIPRPRTADARRPEPAAWWERATIASLDASAACIAAAADLGRVDEPADVDRLRQAIALRVACSIDAPVAAACRRILDEMAALDDLAPLERVRRWTIVGPRCRSFFDALRGALDDVGRRDVERLYHDDLDGVLRMDRLDPESATVLARPLRVPATARFRRTKI